MLGLGRTWTGLTQSGVVTDGCSLRTGQAGAAFGKTAEGKPREGEPRVAIADASQRCDVTRNQRLKLGSN